MDSVDKTKRPMVRLGLILLFLAATFLVFFIFFNGAYLLGMLRSLPLGVDLKIALVLGIQAAVTVGSLAAALAFRRNARLEPYWRLAFSYFVASLALFLSGFAGDWAVTLSGKALWSAEGFTALKLGEDAAIIVTILLLALLTRDNLEELFLAKGRLWLGLLIGIPGFLVLAALGLYLTLAKGIQLDTVLALLPAFLLIALADGFMEEMLFRGLFLGRLAKFLGANWANVILAVVFTLMHLDVRFVNSLPLFLGIVFLLGVLCGWIMQKTGSVLAPALLHAGLDMLIITDLFIALGIKS